MTVKIGILSELLNSIVNEHIEVIDLSQVLNEHTPVIQLPDPNANRVGLSSGNCPNIMKPDKNVTGMIL